MFPSSFTYRSVQEGARARLSRETYQVWKKDTTATPARATYLPKRAFVSPVYKINHFDMITPQPQSGPYLYISDHLTHQQADRSLP